MKRWNQISQTERVCRSRYTGAPILERLNTVYGYYATRFALTEEQYEKLLNQPSYTGPLHPAEEKYNANAHLCG